MYRKVKKRKLPMYPWIMLTKENVIIKVGTKLYFFKINWGNITGGFPPCACPSFLPKPPLWAHLSTAYGVVIHISVSAFAQSCSFLNIADVFSVIIRVLPLIQRLSWQSITWSKWRFWLLYVSFSTGHCLFSACNLSRLEWLSLNSGNLTKTVLTMQKSSSHTREQWGIR